MLHLSALCHLALLVGRPKLGSGSLEQRTVSTAELQAPQVLSVFDPKTRSKVVLVGTMHFNPRSIALARDVVQAEGRTGRLRAVAVESCATRWNATLDAQPQGSVMRWLCDNEMQSGAEAGEAFEASIELVDQTIEETGRRIAQTLALTLVELVTFRWDRIAADIGTALQQCKGGRADGRGLGPFALLDPQLLIGAPLSFVRYPLSMGVKSPVLLGMLGLIFAVLSQDYPVEDTLLEVLGTVGFAVFETVVLGRVLLVALLEERNYVIARNIRKACFAGKPGGTVVAVLGAAHVNGVAALLEDSRIV